MPGGSSDIAGPRSSHLGAGYLVGLSTRPAKARNVRCQTTSEQGDKVLKLEGGVGVASQSRVQRFLQKLQVAAALQRTPTTVEEEVALRKIGAWQSRIVDPAEPETLELELETADEYFRGKGASFPGLVALSLWDSFVLALRLEGQPAERANLQFQHRRRAPEDEDWSTFAKYDVFKEVLTSSPLLREAKFQPLKALLRASPRSGVGKYDFIQAVLQGISSEPTGSHKWDLVHEVLHAGREEAQLLAKQGQPERLRKYDIVYDLLHSAQLHADWGLPTSGFAHDVLHFDEWGARDSDPVARFFENAWHGGVRYKWDPLAAAFGVVPPKIRAKWDPLQAVLAADAPKDGWVDPVGDILQNSKLRRLGDSKYNPLPELFAAKPPPRGGSDLVGDVIRGLNSLDLRGTPDAVGDILKGLLKLDLRGTPDAVGDILKGLNRADFRSGPSLSGLSGSSLPQRRSKYFPRLFEVTEPSGRAAADPFADLVDTLKAGIPRDSSLDPVAELQRSAQKDNLSSQAVRSGLREAVPSQTGDARTASGAVPANQNGGWLGRASSWRSQGTATKLQVQTDADVLDALQRQGAAPGASEGSADEFQPQQSKLARAGSGLQARWQRLSEQSKSLRSRFNRDSSRSEEQAGESLPAGEEQIGVRLQNASLLQQLQEAEERQRRLTSGDLENYDLVPDILRLQAAMSAGTVGGYDPLIILERRGGPQRIQALTTACRELALDTRMALKHEQLFRLLHSGWVPAAAAAEPRAEIGGALLEDLRMSRKYSPLHSLLAGQRPETTIGVICALSALTVTQRV